MPVFQLDREHGVGSASVTFPSMVTAFGFSRRTRSSVVSGETGFTGRGGFRYWGFFANAPSRASGACDHRPGGQLARSAVPASAAPGPSSASRRVTRASGIWSGGRGCCRIWRSFTHCSSASQVPASALMALRILEGPSAMIPTILPRSPIRRPGSRRSCTRRQQDTRIGAGLDPAPARHGTTADRHRPEEIRRARRCPAAR